MDVSVSDILFFCILFKQCTFLPAFWTVEQALGWLCISVYCSLNIRHFYHFFQAFTNHKYSIRSKLRACSAHRFSTCLGLFWLISSHIILFILPAEHYSSDQPNSLCVDDSLNWICFQIMEPLHTRPALRYQMSGTVVWNLDCCKWECTETKKEWSRAMEAVSNCRELGKHHTPKGEGWPLLYIAVWLRVQVNSIQGNTTIYL